ncbi:MAG: minor capsid protein [Oscillospiraceae bacterium]
MKPTLNFDTLVAQKEGLVSEAVKGAYKTGYYKSCFEVQRGFNVGFDIGQIDEDKLEKLIRKPWAVDGYNFSERIWWDKNKLLNLAHQEITKSAMLGSSPDKAIKAIAQAMGTSEFNARRLVMTESSYFHALGEKKMYSEFGYEKYEVISSHSAAIKTCELCAEMDGKIFLTRDFEPGLNANPFHPNCRCTTIAFDPDDDLEDMKSGELDYEQWYKKYVEGREQPKLESKDRAAVEIPKQPVSPAPVIAKPVEIDAEVLTDTPDSDIIGVDDNMQRFKEKLNNGLVNTTIDKRNQQNHTLSVAWLNSVKQAFNAIASGKSVTPKSRLFKQYAPQLLADAYCGKGRLEYRVGSNNFDEFVELPFDVGVTFEKSTRKYVKTKVLQIKYSDKGVHLFPTKEMRK